MHRVGCISHIVDPTLDANRSAEETANRADFVLRTRRIGASVNSSVGLGRDNTSLLLRGHRAAPLVSLRTLLRERFPGRTRHLSVLKVDVRASARAAALSMTDSVMQRSHI